MQPEVASNRKKVKIVRGLFFFRNILRKKINKQETLKSAVPAKVQHIEEGIAKLGGGAKYVKKPKSKRFVGTPKTSRT